MPSICLETEVDGCMGSGVIRSSVLIILNMHVQLIKQSINSYKRHKYIHVLLAFNCCSVRNKSTKGQGHCTGNG